MPNVRGQPTFSLRLVSSSAAAGTRQEPAPSISTIQCDSHSHTHRSSPAPPPPATSSQQAIYQHLVHFPSLIPVLDTYIESAVQYVDIVLANIFKQFVQMPSHHVHRLQHPPPRPQHAGPPVPHAADCRPLHLRSQVIRLLSIQCPTQDWDQYHLYFVYNGF